MSRLAYVVNAFPVVSETFVLNELRAVERAGVEIVVFALARGGPAPVHRAVSELRGPVLHPPDSLAGKLLAHVRFAVRHPLAYLRHGWESRRELRPGTRARTRREAERLLQRFDRAVWIAEACGRLGATHLHAHYAKEPLEMAARVRRLAGIPYSFTAHAKDLYTSPPKRLARRLRDAEFAVTCHTAGYEELVRIGGDESGGKVKYVPHGIDTDLFHPARGRRHPGLILAVGRLTPKKGFDELVRACGLLRDRGVEFRCEIIGEGREKRPLRSAIEAAGLADRVRLRRFVPQEELRRFYRRAAVVAAPAVQTDDGNRDGLQNVVLEAMACGVAVVGTSVGGIPEAIEGERTGLLVAPRDPEALADALQRLIEDPAYAERLGADAAERAAKLDFRQTVAPLVERLRAASASRQPIEPQVRAAADRAWKTGRLADRSADALGIRPVRQPQVEREIERRILPGLRANAWRPDFERIVARRLWDEFYKARRIARLERALGGALPEAGALDLGCGRGGLSVALRARGAKVIGLDFRARNCQMARWRARRYELEIPACNARGEQLPFADGSFELVCCLEVLEHAEDPAALLAEIKRVLTPGGACALTIVNRFAHRDPHYHLWGVNFLPRSWAMRYVRWRGRSKISSGDRQSLDDMHYYRWTKFVSLAKSFGFRVEDPGVPERSSARILHRLGRASSLGFNDALVILRA